MGVGGGCGCDRRGGGGAGYGGEGVRKRVSTHTHIDMIHLLCTSLTLSSKYCTHTVKVKFRGWL